MGPSSIQLEPLAATVGHLAAIINPSSRYLQPTWSKYAVHKAKKNNPMQPSRNQLNASLGQLGTSQGLKVPCYTHAVHNRPRVSPSLGQLGATWKPVYGITMPYERILRCISGLLQPKQRIDQPWSGQNVAHTIFYDVFLTCLKTSCSEYAIHKPK